MPELYPIQSILWQGLLRDLQIQGVPRVPTWWLSDIVQPVAIVNSQIVFQARLDESEMGFATAGTQVVPAANTILADTGALDAGRYLFRTYAGFRDQNADNEVRIEKRNFDNTANVWDYEQHGSNVDSSHFSMEWVENLAANERVRILVVSLAGAASRYNGIIWRRLLSS